jgi:Spy/CpxP family protein refolding chaperone
MKANHIICLALLGGALALTLPAQEARNRRAVGAGLQQWQQAIQELNLTEDQRQQLRAYLQEHGGKLRGLREDQSLSSEQKLAKLREFQEGMTGKMKEVLTREQFAEWEKKRATFAAGARPEAPAEKPAAEEKPAREPKAAEKPATTGSAAGRDRMRQGFAELNLSSEQQEQVRAAMQEQAARLKEIREDQNLSREDKAAKFREMQEKMSAKMKEILNAEQYAKWEKMRGQFAGRFGGAEELRKRRGKR